MADEVIIEGDQPPAPAPVVVTVVTPEGDSGPDESTLAELEELRAFKAKVDEERMAKAEADVAAALVLAEMALEESQEEPEDEIIVPVEEPETHEEPKEDVPPTKSHPWFKKIGE